MAEDVQDRLLKLIRSNHVRMFGMMERVQNETDPERRAALVVELKRQCAAHLAGEENLFATHLENELELAPLIKQFAKDHLRIRKIMNRLSAKGGHWEKTLDAFKEMVNRHIELTENELLRKARLALAPETEQTVIQKFASVEKNGREGVPSE